MYICVCKAVTDSQIIAAIDNGVCTRKKLGRCLGVGQECGMCSKEISALLQQRVAGPARMSQSAAIM